MNEPGGATSRSSSPHLRRGQCRRSGRCWQRRGQDLQIKLLNPNDTLLLGQVYRFTTSQELMKALQAPKHEKMQRCEAIMQQHEQLRCVGLGTGGAERWRPGREAGEGQALGRRRGTAEHLRGREPEQQCL
uniref:Uncharacterized protein n=1 Tax=Arundo donax TaxID=35708 RepID=A0A0A9FF37_ARUDO